MSEELLVNGDEHNKWAQRGMSRMLYMVGHLTLAFAHPLLLVLVCVAMMVLLILLVTLLNKTEEVGYRIAVGLTLLPGYLALLPMQLGARHAYVGRCLRTSSHYDWSAVEAAAIRKHQNTMLVVFLAGVLPSVALEVYTPLLFLTLTSQDALWWIFVVFNSLGGVLQLVAAYVGYTMAFSHAKVIRVQLSNTLNNESLTVREKWQEGKSAVHAFERAWGRFFTVGCVLAFAGWLACGLFVAFYELNYFMLVDVLGCSLLILLPLYCTTAVSRAAEEFVERLLEDTDPQSWQGEPALLALITRKGLKASLAHIEITVEKTSELTWLWAALTIVVLREALGIFLPSLGE